MSRADVRSVRPLAGALLVVLLAGCVTGTPQDPAAGTPRPTSTASATGASASPSTTPVADPPATAAATPPAPSPAPSAPAPGPAAPARTPVEVVVSWAMWDEQAGQVQVAGYAADVVESGGTCTLTLRLGEHTVTAEQQATPDATTTTCGAVAVPRDRLPQAGTWVAVMSYVSDKSSGSSPDVSIGVP
ncbi:hypothetical protein [Cellulomonas wangsupingiae]|uniref:Uncharacterized protein n=1 Tax=Cellulomonas wangsupingiae TaxID=2968085 RepID=A0ABY5K0P8_9CELL|nr:hypothetical protein [Cellulomonas wangsupingiae]MCC2335685.1 hypothetical protein [Cellulomonas wangsupingiae]UUI63920.1 hypothetical protein NP075_12345 [Cellulomonas wangsupingiae]